MATRTSSGNRAVVHGLFDAINAHDVDAMRVYWTPETVERFPDRTCHGRDEITAYFKALFAAMPDFRMEIVSVAEEAETVFARWVMTATHTGARFQGIDPTGKAIRIDGIDDFTIRDGVVASNFVVFDQMDVARQLGLLPPDGSAADQAVKRGFNALLAVRRRLPR